MTSHRLTALLAALFVLSSALAAQPANNPDPTLELASWNDLPVVAGQLLVGFRPGVDRATKASLQGELPGSRAAEWGDTALMRLAPGSSLELALAAWAQRPEVAFAEPDVLYSPTGTPDDPKWSQQWGPKKVGAAAAWDLTNGNPAVVVAILDSGVLTSHTDLVDHYAYGWDSYANDPDPTDSNGHGTHCAGIAAAMTNNTNGMAGAGYHCSFAAYRCGENSFPTSSLVSAIHAARTAGAHVISMSWGSSFNSGAISTALQTATDAGCVLVGAAGNDGESTPFYPAALPGVLSVASSTPSDARSAFSNYGNWVDVAAPGQGILSTFKNGGYVTMSGTSMATPLVAGLAALVYSQLGGVRSTTAALAVRDAIQSSAVPVGTWVSYGRVDFPAALAALDTSAVPAVVSLTPGDIAVLPGQFVSVSGTGFLGVTGVTVDGRAAIGYSIESDALLTFEPPLPTSFATETILLHEGASVSAPLSLSFAASHPPMLQIPASAAPGQSFPLDFAGNAAHQQLLLASLEPTVFPYQGYNLLLEHVIVDLGLLDGAGSLHLDVTVPANLAAVTVYLQGVTVSAGFVGASDVMTLNLGP
jgi:thermitase